jgi:hypothetical protein
VPDWATSKLLYAATQLADWEITELHQTALSRLYACPNCEAIMWDRARDGTFLTYVPCERLIRIFADLSDRDPLDGIWLRHPRTLADIERERLILGSGDYVVLYDDAGDEVYACLEQTLDQAGNPIAGVWVARPLAADDVAGLRERGL